MPNNLINASGNLAEEMIGLTEKWIGKSQHDVSGEFRPQRSKADL